MLINANFSRPSKTDKNSLYVSAVYFINTPCAQKSKPNVFAITLKIVREFP